MKNALIFLKKEWTEQLRSGRLLTLGLVFALVGIMSPAIAKMTPWLLEMMAEEMASTGLLVGDVTVTALDSWTQFFKNIPIALIAFVLMQSAIFTGEYQSGTLIPVLARGVRRSEVLIAKAAMPVILWTLGYWVSFAITYGYNAWFWTDPGAPELMAAVLCWWGFGLWTVAVLVLASVMASTGTGVLLGVGGAVVASFLSGLVPKLSDWVPTALMAGDPLARGTMETPVGAIAVAAVTGAVCLAVSVPLFDKKHI
jgi:ABC-2 type transport system permease protein